MFHLRDAYYHSDTIKFFSTHFPNMKTIKQHNVGIKYGHHKYLIRGENEEETIHWFSSFALLKHFSTNRYYI